MRHPLSRIFGGIAIIVSLAFSAVAVEDQYGMQKQPKSGIVEAAVAAGQRSPAPGESLW